jgi:hypothetical protein
MARGGMFRQSVAESQKQYDQIAEGIPTLIHVVREFHEATESHAQDIREIRSMICQLLIVAYREAKKKNPEIALTFARSLVDDYPGLPESCLLPRWHSLAQASLVMREASYSQNPLLVWQQMCKNFQAYNEFLNGLLSYLIVLLRTSLEKPINPGIFDANYANKVSDFNALTGGEDGAFYILSRIAQPRIRNAIAHENIWLDSEANVVRFTEGRGPDKVESEMSLDDFGVLSMIGSHLSHTYVAALAVIAVMEDGTELAHSLLPPYLANVFDYEPTTL